MTNNPTPHHQPLNCTTVRAELVSLLYDELDATECTNLKRHLESCADCRAELANHQSTSKLLDEWDITTTDLAPPPELTLTADHSIPPAPLTEPLPSVVNRWRPLFIGVSAALVIFACLAALNTNIQIQNGQTILTIGTPTVTPPPNPWPGDPKLVISDLKAFARAETDNRIDTLLDSLEDYLAEFRREEELRRHTLIQAVDLRRAQDQREQSIILQSIAKFINDQSYQTQDALDEIRTHFARQPVQGTFDNAKDSNSESALNIESEEDIH